MLPRPEVWHYKPKNISNKLLGMCIIALVSTLLLPREYHNGGGGDDDDDDEYTNLCNLCFLLFLLIYSSLSISFYFLPLYPYRLYDQTTMRLDTLSS